ncbi:DEAD/DEAH box helicase [Lewinella cohaerens]|uniref:DEAD/DEAH box helicase n=1 Tax=Lewinella cohaerens TaxID=70995 RepID=UPI00035C3D01|nr:DEAD/DEAH box helicase [Lewinella cohaerens]
MSYADKILSLSEPSFEGIRAIAKQQIAHLPNGKKNQLYRELERGTALLASHEQMCMYLYAFGNMHQAKLRDAFRKIPEIVYQGPLEIVDWGCGQAMGTVNLFDHLKTLGLAENVKKVTLIEPSLAALQRGELHVKPYVGEEVALVAINEYFERLSPTDIKGGEGRTVLHLFSNILDVAQIDLKHLANTVDDTVVSDNYLICVGPLNPTNHRLDAFLRYFDSDLIKAIYEFETSTLNNRNWTYKARIYQLAYNQQGHLIPIEYYPTVQFQAAYELDGIGTLRKKGKLAYDPILTHFEVAAPFDLGASVYDDVHPILAVLNNMICRGLPTKSSIYIEEEFRRVFGLTRKEEHYGEVKFTAIEGNETLLESSVQLFQQYLDSQQAIAEEHKIPLQLLLTPIAIARFQKVLLEAIITEQLSLEQDTWRILIEEKDVPYGRLGVKDFQHHFHHLTQLSEEYDTLFLPKIELYIVSNQDFYQSALQAQENVFVTIPNSLKNMDFDMVVTQSMLKSVASDIESFSTFKVGNDCYFNIRTINEVRTNRIIYTSDLIRYKNLVQKTQQGAYEELETVGPHVNYFLQLLFRKATFRPGQLPILDRALQNLPVIGLLPTGGGKSLTYQIAALLQPGVTMVIDPLKSLMKDQLDGLIANGIDCAAYINSSLSREERAEVEKKLESSELLMTFLSPERLSILSFRERLKNMHNYNVYFSYGVIDEVHCVSEWGHDFRFSYLHLGRNLYNYVRGKNKEISLLGLTATASFDVLADVERELSGNGAFDLDADTVVRYENTNRLELQYKVERVPVEFGDDQFYDQNGIIDPSLPRALNVTNKWASFDSKSNFLSHYYQATPGYLTELQTAENTNRIKEQFTERQNDNSGMEEDLSIGVDHDYYAPKSDYDQAGIVFCPHVNKTGLSVRVNEKNLLGAGVEDITSYSGQDNDDLAMKSLDRFRDNKSPLMVATKAFGMGIDKPNVRFTVNMNYSSSLEAFVQEAGRAGRDKKMALATILVSDYNLAQVSRQYQSNQFPVSTLKNKWFKQEDLEQILQFYNLEIPEEFIQYASPANDIVKLHCKHDNKMFALGKCNAECTAFKGCSLRKVSRETKGWRPEEELIQELKVQGLNITRKAFQYLNADYQTIMFFYGLSFKGALVEKRFMYNLMKVDEIVIQNRQGVSNGFLSALTGADIDTEVIAFIPYTKDNSTDLSKAIYRMCCIELIEDFTIDYRNKQFRIVASRKQQGAYYGGLQRFLERYYTSERAALELEKAKNNSLNQDDFHSIEEEIYKCLAYLIEFIYDKISEKRKRAINDMRDFCMEGSIAGESWLLHNERMKDFLYYYFNSKFAKSDYVAENGEPFSLVEDTEGGKKSSEGILFKYLRVIDDDVVGIGTPLDNIKHLHGAIRLISRSLTDSNPALSLLEAFCLAYLGVENNQNLRKSLKQRYTEGMIDFSERFTNLHLFWEVFTRFNEFLSSYLDDATFEALVTETTLLLHVGQLNKIKDKYLENYA